MPVYITLLSPEIVRSLVLQIFYAAENYSVRPDDLVRRLDDPNAVVEIKISKARPVRKQRWSKNGRTARESCTSGLQTSPDCGINFYCAVSSSLACFLPAENDFEIQAREYLNKVGFDVDRVATVLYCPSFINALLPSKLAY